MKHKIIALIAIIGFGYVIANDSIVNNKANQQYDEAIAKQTLWEQTLTD